MDISTLLTQNPGDYALSLGHFLDLSTRAMGAFRLPLDSDRDCAGGGNAGQPDPALHQHDPDRKLRAVAMMVVFLIAAHMALVTFSPVLSSKALADAIRPRLKTGDVVEINGEYEAGSTLGFYLRRQVRILNGRSSDLWYGSFFSDAPHIFDDDASFRRLWSGPQRIFLWTQWTRFPRCPDRLTRSRRAGGRRSSATSRR